MILPVILVPKPMAQFHTLNFENTFNMDLDSQIYKARKTDESTLASQPINKKGIKHDVNYTIHGNYKRSLNASSVWQTINRLFFHQ